MPRYPIDRATNFIVEEESWTVVEYDRSSVPGVIYLSLTESKVNMIYDDLDKDIADLDKLARYNLSIPEGIQTFKIHEVVNPIFTLMKNGVPSDEEIEFISMNKRVVKTMHIDTINQETGEKECKEALVAVAKGTAEIVIQLKQYPAIKKTIIVQVGEEKNEFSAYIDGSDILRLDRIGIYTLKGTEEITGKVSYSISDNTLAKIVEVKDNNCSVRANAKNKLGTITISAVYNDNTYTKEISIVPLW